MEVSIEEKSPDFVNYTVSISVMYSGCLRDRYTGLGALFQVFKYFNKKHVEVAIINFAMHLIISKRLRRQKCRHKVKRMRRKEEAKEETVHKSVFIYYSSV